MEDGEEVTITNTCAANVLGLVQEEHFLMEMSHLHEKPSSIS